ncbi:HAD family hydrolase [Anaerosporobacter sp.]|uniref:HAD family hydrolase n=1 Tax=Anaerosporobacter sp. TaxID=1872529 RepID=UPI00286EDB3F|nr:HAD family hydrolase [Anaerosporobacter sp.]
MFNTYIFDLYGTLVDIRTDEESWDLWSKMSLLYQYQGANYTPEELKTAFEQAVKQAFDKVTALDADKSLEKKTEADANINLALIKREIQIEYVYQGLFQDKGIEVSLTSCIQLAQIFRALSTKYVKLYKGAIELLQALKAKNKKVYLLSNAQAVFTKGELELLGLLPYFDGIALSSDIGFMKPDSRFYQYLLETYQIDPSTAIMIGNDYNSDTVGGSQVGLHTCYINSNLSPKEDADRIADMEADFVLERMDLERVKQLILV